MQYSVNPVIKSVQQGKASSVSIQLEFHVSLTEGY